VLVSLSIESVLKKTKTNPTSVEESIVNQSVDSKTIKDLILIPFQKHKPVAIDGNSTERYFHLRWLFMICTIAISSTDPTADWLKVTY